jgi:hypothetical protein
MLKKVTALMYKLDTVKLPRPKNFINAVREKKISEAMFEQNGAAMALQWVLDYESSARQKQKDVDEEEELNQLDLDRIKARKDKTQAMNRLAYVQACKASGVTVDETPDDDVAFDPFPDEVHPPMSSIDWDEGIVASIRVPIDAKLPEYGQEKRPVTDNKSAWISGAQIFDGIFKESETEEDPSQGMAMLTQMAAQVL